MSAILLYFQDTAQMTLQPWMGPAGFVALTAAGFGVQRIIKSSLDKKIDKNQFTEYKEGHDKIHEDLKEDLVEVKSDIKYLVRREKKKEKDE